MDSWSYGAASRLRPLAIALAALALVACEDAPTTPDALQRFAGGRQWVAVPVPDALPSAETWLGHLDGERGARTSRAIDDGLAAVNDWSTHVRTRVDLERAPELAQSLRAVEASRGAALRALEAGDTTAALLALAESGQRIRSHGPTAVALRVLSAVEVRLGERAKQGPSPSVTRAMRLLRSARQELAAGDPSRALQRALYALQLADGRGLPTLDRRP